MIDHNHIPPPSSPPFRPESEQFVTLSIDLIPFGCIRLDEERRVQDWNRAAEAIFGWTRSEVQGRKADELLFDEGSEMLRCLYDPGLLTGKTLRNVSTCIGKNGARRVCECHVTAARDAAGSISGTILMVNDITERNQAEQELRDSRKLLQTIIDSEPECVKLLNPDGTLIMMNRAGLEMIEAESLDTVKGQSVCPMITPKDRDAFNELTRQVFQGGSGSLTFEMVGFHGRKLWLETRAVPLRNDRDEIVALLGITRDVTERKRAEEVLKKERDFTNAILDTVGSIVLVLDNTGRIVRFNRTCEEVSGYAAAEVTGKYVWDLLVPPEQVDGVRNVFKSLVSGMFPNRYENYWMTKDGSRRLIAWSNTALLAADGSVEFVIPTGIDITEHRRLEEQLRHSQKMESIGTLAGGIAHDFNNILTAIIGYGSLLQMKMKEDDPFRYNIEQILCSANRAATLTQGLLAYSRKQILNAQPVSLNEIIRKVELLLKRLIGEDIELKTLLTDSNVTVMADSGQIEQVLMNLATNARDAMPDGGCLFIETEQLVLDKETARIHDFGKPGMFALVTVTDSGSGMDEKTRERIFDPFFTTKEVGKGTGLGLSMAYGIIKQHNGTIAVYSEAGRGTTFKIYLPLVQSEVKEVPSVALAPLSRGTETILVAEDDEIVRVLTSHILREFGYQVIEAIDGEDAVNKFMEHKEQIRLLLLDVIMPKKNGREVFSKIRIFHPEARALFLSGYTADIMQQKGLLEPGVNFIMKPVPVNELLRMVRTIINGSNGQQESSGT